MARAWNLAGGSPTRVEETESLFELTRIDVTKDSSLDRVLTCHFDGDRPPLSIKLTEAVLFLLRSVLLAHGGKLHVLLFSIVAFIAA